MRCGPRSGISVLSVSRNRDMSRLPISKVHQHGLNVVLVSGVTKEVGNSVLLEIQIVQMDLVGATPMQLSSCAVVRICLRHELAGAAAPC